MTLPFVPRPGQILLFKRGRFDPVGSFITAEQGDSEVCHAACIGLDYKAWTTGADFPFRFGKEDLEFYLAGREYHVCEYDGITPIQVKQVDLVFQRFQGQVYGFHKITWLVLRAKFGGIVRQLYPWGTPPARVKKPFCSESVAAAYWMAGMEICGQFPGGSVWKKEPSAITPENLMQYAQMKGTRLNVVYSSG